MTERPHFPQHEDDPRLLSTDYFDPEPQEPTIITHDNGVEQYIFEDDCDWMTYARSHGLDLAMCGHCERIWDDGLSTSVTPTPAGRCPFEYDHVHSYSDLAEGTLPELREFQVEMDRLAIAEMELPLPGDKFEGRTVVASGWHTDYIWAIMSLEDEAPYFRVDEVPLLEFDPETLNRLYRFTHHFPNIVPAAQFFDEQFGLYAGA